MIQHLATGMGNWLYTMGVRPGTQEAYLVVVRVRDAKYFVEVTRMDKIRNEYIRGTAVWRRM